MHTFTFIHSGTRMNTNYCFTLRLLFPFNLYVCLIYCFSFFVINLCLSMPLCLISVVSCYGVNTQRRKKVELIEISWLLFWITLYCLLLCLLNLSPFPEYFYGVKCCSKLLSFLWNAHCMVAVILLLSYFQTSILDVFADTNWSNLRGNLEITYFSVFYYDPLIADSQA